MRLIFSLIAIANIRWADAAFARAERLDRESDRSLDDVRRHLATAHAFADRAGIRRA